MTRWLRRKINILSNYLKKRNGKREVPVTSLFEESMSQVLLFEIFVLVYLVKFGIKSYLKIFIKKH